MNCLFKQLISIVFLLSIFIGQAQQLPDNIMVSKTGDTIRILPIPLVEINSRLEQVNTSLKRYKDILKPVPEVIALDSMSKKATNFLIQQKQIIYDTNASLTIRAIDDYKREWFGYDDELEKWQAVVSQRITDIDKQTFNLDVSINTWDVTKTAATKDNSPQELISRLNDLLVESKNIASKLKAKQDSLIILQNNFTDFQLEIDDALEFLSVKRKDLQSDYFIRDSYYIWNASDSTIRKEVFTAQIVSAFNQNVRSFKLFIDTNSSKVYTHLFITILFLFLFFFVFTEFRTIEILDEDKRMKDAKFFLSHYISSGFLISLIISAFIYLNIPATISELIQLLMLLPSLFLLRNYSNKKLHPIIYTLLFLFVIDEFQVLLDPKSFIARIAFILENLILLWILFKIESKNSPIRDIAAPQWFKFSRQLARILIFFTIVTLLANIIGYVNLSLILTNANIIILLTGVVLYLAAKVVDALIVGFIKSKYAQLSNIVRKYEKSILDKFYKLLVYFAIFLWIRSTFTALGLKEQFGNWLTGLMDVNWEIGTGSISLGGIIGFAMAIVLTIVITRMVRYLLEDEIFPRIRLPRGVPGAISMVIRYVIVAYGIYIAMSAAGIDLGKFGFIAGALGVGIGFGLQGVVYNFIAGLILAFERPIQKGDTIQVGTLMGDVTEIGVRASTVKTYDGAEVIVPNGNLISTELTNWTLSDRRKRREVKVGVAYGSDPREVMRLLSEITSRHEEVLINPKPWPLFVGFGESSLDFRVLFWVSFDRGMTVQSEVAMAIYDALGDAGIQIPFPQTDLHVKSFDPTIQKTIIPFRKNQKDAGTESKI